ncbi:hypothetical protein BV20DRAFT_1024247 [Pilatotrama ljubarskyi]|nr:hypothetical protein BV20DRAFT_1024247 [Pilatotrama ljubarskyi]
MPLHDLPEDVLLDIFQHLHAHDILSLRQTCKALESATRERTVWHEALSRHSRQSRLPIPALAECELWVLSASDLERLTLRALRFWANWQSPRPEAYKHVPISPIRSMERSRGARNLAVVFLPNLPGHVLTLTLYNDNSQDRRYSFELWDVRQTSKAIHVDHLALEGLLGYAVNSDPDGACTMAVTRRDSNSQCISEAYNIEVPRVADSSAFRLVHQFPGYRYTIGLHGSHLVATDSEQGVRIIDVNAGRLLYTLRAPIMLNDPTLRFTECQCLDIALLDGFVLSFCKQYIFLYRIPATPHEHEHDGQTTDTAQEAPTLDAIATYKWRWRIDSLVAKPRREPPGPTGLSHGGWASATAHHPDPPLIDILIRFDTWFPWPVNILHHFVLAPNPAYHASTVSLADPTTFPYLLSTTDGPFMVHSIPSPLRIFTPSDIVLGPYGTALWIDASTDTTTPSQAGDHGQRIAGKVLTRTPLPHARARVRPGEGPQDDQVSPGPVPVEPGAMAPAAPEEVGELSGMADPAVRGPAVSVFHVQEVEEKWNRVAVDEEGGRVAVGHVDGRVSVYSYVPE